MNAFRKCGQEPRQGSRTVGVWDGACSVGRVQTSRPFGTVFSWLQDERPGFPERRRYPMWEEWHKPRLRDRNEQVTEDRKVPGQRPRDTRSGQTHMTGSEP